MNDISPIKALQNSGTLPADKLREIVTGVQTITPIIVYLIEQNKLNEIEAFKKILADVRNLQLRILKHATDSHFSITPMHFVSVNRLALNIVCSRGFSIESSAINDIALLCTELFEMDDIYAEKMRDEYTDNEFTLQFIGVSELATVIINHLISTNNVNDGDEIMAELMHQTIELVDLHIDEIYDDFIGATSSIDIRSHLISQASKILKAILLQEKANTYINTSLLIKKFELAYRTYIEAVTLSSKMRG